MLADKSSEIIFPLDIELPGDRKNAKAFKRKKPKPYEAWRAKHLSFCWECLYLSRYEEERCNKCIQQYERQKNSQNAKQRQD